MKDKNVTSEKSFIRKTSSRIKETLLGQKREKKNILQPLFIPEEVVKLGKLLLLKRNYLINSDAGGVKY